MKKVLKLRSYEEFMEEGSEYLEAIRSSIWNYSIRYYKHMTDRDIVLLSLIKKELISAKMLLTEVDPRTFQLNRNKFLRKYKKIAKCMEKLSSHSNHKEEVNNEDV